MPLFDRLRHRRDDIPDEHFSVLSNIDWPEPTDEPEREPSHPAHIVTVEGPFGA
jgi:hypothetical protein